MTNETLIAEYNAAMNAGNNSEVLRLANLIDWVAAAPAPVTVHNTVNFNTGSALSNYQEATLLKRGEDFLFA